MLKLVIVQSDVRGCASKLAKVHRDRAKDTDRKPLGWLVEDFFKTVYSNGSASDGSPNELDEVWMSISVRIDSDKDSIRNRKRELSELITERNWLIHSSLADLDLDSVDSCKKLISLLDEQDDRLKPHYLSLMRLIGNIQVAQQELFKQLEAHLRESVREGGTRPCRGPSGHHAILRADCALTLRTLNGHVRHKHAVQPNVQNHPPAAS